MTEMQHPRRLRMVWAGADADMAGLAGSADWLLRAGYDGTVPAGMKTMVDFDLAQTAVRVGLPEVFTALPAPSTDPRHAPASSSIALALLGTDADADRLAIWAGQQIAALPAGGVRLLGLDQLPASLLGRVLTRLRRAAPDTLLFGWLAGLSASARDGVPPGTLDAVSSSLPWWDGHAAWIWAELTALERIAPVVLPAASAADDQPRWLHLAATLGDGWLVPAGSAAGLPDTVARGSRHVLSAPGAPILAVLRTDTPDMRQACTATLALSADQAAAVPAATLLAAMGRPFTPFHTAEGTALDGLTLAAGQGAILRAEAIVTDRPAPLLAHVARAAGSAARLALEAPSPTVDAGRFPARRVVGEDVPVTADLIGDGHDKFAGILRWTAPHDETVHETPLAPLGNDRWGATLPLRTLGVHIFTLLAWRDEFATYADGLLKKSNAGVSITLELQEGVALVDHVAHAADRAHRPALTALQTALQRLDAGAQLDLLLSVETADLMRAADPRAFSTQIGPFPLQAERAGAAYAAWYEVFPRSLSDDPACHGTFRDVILQLPRIQAMGFDVLYFPPVHPIGTRNRKGRNNTLTPAADDPGSPYAIGAADGGHDALHAELGTFEDFQALRQAAAEHGLELALDFAIQC